MTQVLMKLLFIIPRACARGKAIVCRCRCRCRHVSAQKSPALENQREVYKYSQIVRIGEKLASICFESLRSSHERLLGNRAF